MQARGPPPDTGFDVAEADELGDVAADGAGAHAQDMRERGLAGIGAGAVAAAGAQDGEQRLGLRRETPVPRGRGRHVPGILEGRPRLRPVPAGGRCGRRPGIEPRTTGSLALEPHHPVGKHGRGGSLKG